MPISSVIQRLHPSLLTCNGLNLLNWCPPGPSVESSWPPSYACKWSPTEIDNFYPYVVSTILSSMRSKLLFHHIALSHRVAWFYQVLPGLHKQIPVALPHVAPGGGADLLSSFLSPSCLHVLQFPLYLGSLYESRETKTGGKLLCTLII